MIALLKLVPAWAYALAVVLLLSIGAAGVQTYRLMSLKAEYSDHLAQDASDKAIAESAARQEEQRRQAAIDQVRTDAQKQKALDDAAAAKLLADGKQLRDQTTRLLADRATLNSRLARAGKTEYDLTVVLAQLRNEAGDYASQLATALDSSRRAGFACEQSFDSLRVVK